MDGGFPHHLALARGDILQELRQLCTFLGVELVTPHADQAA